MKEIIYLNTDLMNSMLAQLNRGLIKNFSQEQSNQETLSAGQQSTLGEKAGIKGEFRVGTGFFPGAEFRLGSSLGNDGKETTMESHTILEGARDILNKEFHDHSLEILTEMLFENKLLKETGEFVEGDIYLGNSSFDYYDFDLISKSVNHDLMEKLMLFGVHDKNLNFKEASKIVNKNGKLTAKEREQLEDAKIVYQAYKSTEPIVRIMKMLNEFSNYASNLLKGLSVIKTENKIGLLRKNFLRETSEALSFRTDNSRKVKYLVRIIGKKNEVSNGFNIPQFNPNEIGKIPNIILDILLGSFDILKSGDLLVTPIAIYYE